MPYGNAPGTHTKNDITSTLNAPFSKAANAHRGVGGGQYNANKAPFDKPQSAGGIDTKFFDGTASRGATVKQPGGVVQNSSLGTISTSRRGTSSM